VRVRVSIATNDTDIPEYLKLLSMMTSMGRVKVCLINLSELV